MNPADSMFGVGFKQLAPDAKNAGVEYRETERQDVSGKELRALLRSVAELAPHVAYPLTPELRILAPSGRFVVQLRDGRLHFVSWSSAKSRGGNPTADQIFAIITGQEVEDDATPVAAAGKGGGDRSGGAWRWVAGTVLLVAFLGINIYSVWNYRKPPGNLLPPFKILEPGPAKRTLEKMVGNYETGEAPGDRRLEIKKDGRAAWIKFGSDRAAVERREFTVQGAQTGGQDAFFTSRKSLIKVKDNSSVLLFGDLYLRVAR